MKDPVMRDEFPADQRVAVCYSQWRRVRGGKPPKKMEEGYILKWDKVNEFIDLIEKLTAEVGDEFIRVRVKSPDDFDRRSFRTIDIDTKKKIKAVVACPKGKFKAGRCQVGTEVQAFLFYVNKWTEQQALAWVREHI